MKKILTILVLILILIIPVSGEEFNNTLIENFDGEALSDSIIRLTWMDSSNVSYDHIEIYKNSIWVTNVSSWVKMYDVVGLLNNTTYTFQAIPVDYLGNTYSQVNCSETTLAEGYTRLLPLEIDVERGSSWIKWEWNNFILNQTVNKIILDGFYLNTPENEYLISDLNPNEEHILELFHNDTLLVSSKIKTHPNEASFILILLLSIIFLVSSIFVKSIYQIILTSTLAFLLSTYLILSSTQTFWVVSLVGLFISIISGVILIMTLLDLYYD